MKITFKVRRCRCRRRCCCCHRSLASQRTDTGAGSQTEQVRHRGRAIGNGTPPPPARAANGADHVQIGELKAKIQADKGWEVPQQKLIYSGKILQDANTVASYSIEEKGFIVCMVSKVRPCLPVPALPTDSLVTQPKAASAASAASSSSKAPPATPARPDAQTPAAPAAPAAPSSVAAQNVPATPSPAPAQQASGGPQFNDPSALTMGGEREAAVANMESMGFQRTDIDRAMRAAFFNPDRAVEYLLTVRARHSLGTVCVLC